MFKKLCGLVLIWAERLYLKSHGWERTVGEYYAPPLDYDCPHHDEYPRCHAVNAQRQRGRKDVSRTVDIDPSKTAQLAPGAFDPRARQVLGRRRS